MMENKLALLPISIKEPVIYEDLSIFEKEIPYEYLRNKNSKLKFISRSLWRNLINVLLR
jgi:hypothetical protein